MYTLPLIVPREDLSIWPSSPLHRAIQATESSSSQPSNRRNSTHTPAQSSQRSFLAQLSADEAMISQRKQNIRRFGAGWIRPPGIPKTYQATMDEIAEKEEQEMLARREAAMQELERAAEEEARREALEAGEAGEGMDEDGEGERDLDDDVPEAEDDADDEDGEGDADGERDLDDDVPDAETEDETEADVTFNEESFIEGSMVQADVEQMLDMEDGQAMMQDERDLDDDVPEAGSYQHTDTEVEDSTSELGGFSQVESARRTGLDNADGRSSMQGAGAGAGAGAGTGAGSMMLSGGSSFIAGSSPAYGRGRLDSPFGPSRSNGR